ncbi:MAG TPA: hypothetical protein VK760_01620 [Candidatus Acidoferrales bacterium]|nr:hypothetical protein [Candidatus Acidoferrales bacterium]
MRSLTVSLLALALLSACQTASYKETKVLTGTSWTATAPGGEAAVSVPELQFGTKLAPSGLGQVRIAPGDGNIALFQVIDDKLVMHLNGKNEKFAYDVEGDTLTLTHLNDKGEKQGVQTFKRASPSPMSS